MDPESKRPEISDWDRQYMKRLGRYIEEANEETLQRHLALSGKERIESSIRLTFEFGSSEAFERALRDDDPSPFYSRARRLGLINRGT